MKNKEMTLNIGPRIRQDHLLANYSGNITEPPMMPIFPDTFERPTAPEQIHHHSGGEAPLATMAQLRTQKLKELKKERAEADHEEEVMYELYLKIYGGQNDSYKQ